MKRFVIAATGLALTSTLALAQTATDSTTTDTTPPAVVVTTPDNMATDVGNAVSTTVDKMENAVDAAGKKVEAEVDGGAADKTATMPATTTDTMPATTTDTMPATTDTMPATTTEPAVVAPATEAAAPVVAPDVNAPMITAEDPGMLGSWVMKRHIWTTNQPSSTAWETVDMAERPADWSDIAKVQDIVLDHQGNLMGYVADIGGFLGIGAKQVLLGKDVLHFVRVGDDAFFATNFTKEELQALPDFDNATVMR